MSKIPSTSENLDSGNSTPEKSPLCILIDGHSLAFRSYYAFSKSRSGPIQTSTGIPTSVCFGFINSLLHILKHQQPDYIIIAFDLQKPSFRHQKDPNYKANRKEAEEDFITDLKNLHQLLTALNLQIITAVGYEADDVLATLAKQASKLGYRVKIVSGDRDLFQLVDETEKISVIYLDNQAIKSSKNFNYPEFDRAAVEDKLGVKPEQVVDYKALCGDKSDNIPGVRGIGEKTAIKLLSEYGNLEAIYQNIEKIKGAVKKKLETGLEDAKKSQYLAKLVDDVPVEIELEKCKLQGFNIAELKPIFRKLELKKFAAQIDAIHVQFGGSPENLLTEDSKDKQLSLFGKNKKQKEEKKYEKSPLKTQIIDDETKLEELREILHRQTRTPVAWDTETTSLEPENAQLVGIGCCWGKEYDRVAYIPINHKTGKQLKQATVLSVLRPILESETHAKVLQNAKFDRMVLWYQGIKLAGVKMDTMLASYILYPEGSHNLKDLAHCYVSRSEIKPKSYEELNIPKTETIADLEIEIVADYCASDAYITFCLFEELKKDLEVFTDQKNILQKIEQPLEPVLAAMEIAGIKIDTAYLKELSEQLAKDLEELKKLAYQDAGREFNLGSPKELSKILFEELELDRRKSRQIKTGYSTDRSTLEKLQGDHPIIDRILEYRTLSKLKYTYVDTLPKLVRKDTQRVHTSFNQTVTSTGRLSSSNPNLQNIPIRTEFSRQIRKAFIPEDNCLLVSADYSQIELRILTHLSQEPILLEAYKNNRDVHKLTAQLLLDKEDITPEERNLGKIINFGVIYGMGAYRFAKEAKVSPEEGKKFIQKYHQRYPRIFAYLEYIKKQAIADGYVSTILGRKRHFDFASNSLRNLNDYQLKNLDLSNLSKLDISNADAQKLRAAANAPIQGSSADIIKIATIKLHNTLSSKYKARLLLQVHDELIFEVPREEIEELQPKIKTTMENAVELSVPLLVEVRAGQNWMEAK